MAAMASGKASVMNNCSSLGNGEGLKNTECYRKLCGRILSPSLEAVELSKKPNILCKSKSTLKNFFQIPEYLCLAPETTSWVGVQAFAERVGYPLVVKGATQGCVLCHNWFEISSCLRQSFR